MISRQEFQQFFQEFFQGMQQTFFPGCCPGCRARLHPGEHICFTCMHNVEPPAPGILEKHLTRLPVPSPFERVFSLGYFRHESRLQRLHQALKYGNRPHLGRILGSWIGKALLRQWPDIRVEVIIPVPLSRIRYLERGYNQSAWLARGISDILRVPVCTDMLIRHRATRTQTRLNRQARWENVRNAFSVRPEHLPPVEAMLLVDDILTSGATATAAALTLKHESNARFYLATLGFAAD